jgi:hypothetical protein
MQVYTRANIGSGAKEGAPVAVAASPVPFKFIVF